MTASLAYHYQVPDDDDFDHLTCKVPRTRTSLGDRSFTAAGPGLWNNISFHLRDSELSSEFRRLLRTHLCC